MLLNALDSTRYVSPRPVTHAALVTHSARHHLRHGHSTVDSFESPNGRQAKLQRVRQFADLARRAGLPPELLVMTALTEARLTTPAVAIATASACFSSAGRGAATQTGTTRSRRRACSSTGAMAGNRARSTTAAGLGNWLPPPRTSAGGRRRCRAPHFRRGTPATTPRHGDCCATREPSNLETTARSTRHHWVGV